VVNGTFVGFAVIRPDLLFSALLNPIAAAFMLEATLLMTLLAWLIWRGGPRSMSWMRFVALSLLGGADV
jgi:hypothetical protein